jgi:arylsulfatase A-like enzyme
VRPWDSLSDQEKRLFARMAEVYAGFLSHADHEIGRLLDYLEDSGQLDNTIIVLVSDNGEGGTADPMIVSWPARITSTGLRHQYVHAIDIVPTLYSLLASTRPRW